MNIYFLIKIIAALITPMILLVLFAPPGMRKKSRNSLPTPNPASINGAFSFIALQYYALILNRTFCVWATDKYICAGRVAGAIASPRTVPGVDWQDAKYYVNTDLLEKYIDVDLESKAFLAKDKANFQILRNDICQIEQHKKKWGMGVVPYSGRIIIKTIQGKRYELILLGRQDSNAICQHISKL